MPTLRSSRVVRGALAGLFIVGCAPVIQGALAAALISGCAPSQGGLPYPTAQPEQGSAPPVASPPSPARGDEVGEVRYFDRVVDLAPFLAGYPYRNFRASLRTDKLFFIEVGDRYTLKMLDVPSSAATQPWALDRARTLSDVDWSERSLWSIHHHAPSQSLWLHADARNDEQMNLWTLSLTDGALEQVTQHDYVYGYGFSPDERQVALLPRQGKKAPFKSCLHLLDVASKSSREIVCDDPKLTFTWSEIQFSPDSTQVFFNALVEGDRNREQLVRVDLAPRDGGKPHVEVLTNPKVQRSSADPLDHGWVGDQLLFVANDDGFDNLHAFDQKTKKIRQLTAFREDFSSAKLSDRGVIGVHKSPAGSTVVQLDPNTGKTLHSQKLSGSASILDAHGGRALLRHEAPDVVFEAFELALAEKGFEATRVAAPAAELQDQIVACDAQAVQIPTFDRDRKTGKTRLLHAFLLRPKRPLDDPKQRLGLITAFYGGRNGYSTFDNIMCAGGLTLVSPAVRGSDGFGREFKALNDKDLGGDEIVDLFAVARWLEEQEGLNSRRIGVYGGSHGGYAVMRALTFVPTTNGRNDLYPFGFGLSHAGFSDIKTFYDATNIPDWVVLESADPSDPEGLAKLKDRSPLTHVDRLSAPLLLTHGSNDWRVPVQESRQFAAAAEALERPVTYVEFEGQGHSIEGLALEARLYQTRFDFLQAVAKAAPTEADDSAPKAPESER